MTPLLKNVEMVSYEATLCLFWWVFISVFVMNFLWHTLHWHGLIPEW